MKFTYPMQSAKKHKNIVKKLLKGEFLCIGSPEYDILQEHYGWYKDFFKESFDVDLISKLEIFYCESLNSKSEKTKNIMIFVAILMYEINKKGKDPVVAIHTTEFSFKEAIAYISDSVQFSSYVEKVGPRFFSEMENLGLIQKTNTDRFIFKKPIDIFLDEYSFLADQLNIEAV